VRKLDLRRKELSRRLAEAEREFLDLESAKRELGRKQEAVLLRKLRIRKEAGLLDDQERAVYAQELQQIEELERCEAEKEVSEFLSAELPKVSELSGLDEFPVEWVDPGLPDDLLVAQWLALPDGSPLIDLGSS